jgi:hypothetical protein
MQKDIDIYNLINDNKINKGKDYIILFIYMIKCTHCQHVKPVFKKEATRHNNCCFIQINYEDITTFLKKQEITEFPTFVLFDKTNNGYKLVKKGSGADYLHTLLSEIDKTQHEYFTLENEIRAPSKKEYSVNRIINNNLRKLTKQLY